MKGAKTDPEEKIRRLPKRIRVNKIGKSQNFFRTFMNDQISDKKFIGIRKGPVAYHKDNSQSFLRLGYNDCHQKQNIKNNFSHEFMRISAV